MDYCDEGFGCAHAGLKRLWLAMGAGRPASGEITLGRVNSVIAPVIKRDGLAVAVFVFLHV